MNKCKGRKFLTFAPSWPKVQVQGTHDLYKEAKDHCHLRQLREKWLWFSLITEHRWPGEQFLFLFLQSSIPPELISVTLEAPLVWSRLYITKNLIIFNKHSCGGHFLSCTCVLLVLNILTSLPSLFLYTGQFWHGEFPSNCVIIYWLL